MRGSAMVERLSESCVLGLTVYELGNVLWKESTRLGRLSKEETEGIASALHQWLGLVEVVRTEPHDVGRILDVAKREGLTFYDASYLKVAIDRGLALVTDDAGLGRAANGRVAVLRAEDL